MNLNDIVRANRRHGYHFFDEDTMRFFDSKVYQGVYGGRFFVTSEKGPDEVRGFTVRRARPDGSIGTVGGFRQWPDLESAIDATEEAARRARFEDLEKERSDQQ